MSWAGQEKPLRSSLSLRRRRRYLRWTQLLSNAYLGGHSCLSISREPRRLLGGPIRTSTDNECELVSGDGFYTASNDLVIWLETLAWFLGSRVPSWSSMRQTGFRMVVCLPTEEFSGMWKLNDLP